MIKACANVLIDTIANIIYTDPHQWSKRPCETCKAITGILGKPFGVTDYKKSNEKEKIE